MELTSSILLKAAPASKKVADIVVKHFNDNAPKYQITTPERMAAFISQTSHESMSFTRTKEIASGKAYEGRKSLGNIYPGDGVKFKGRGYIQITGRSNYSSLSKYLFADDTLLKNPDLLALPSYAMTSAMWYWESRNLNKYADIQFVETLTRKINGGLNGFSDRVRIYNILCKEYGLRQYDIVKRTVI